MQTVRSSAQFDGAERRAARVGGTMTRATSRIAVYLLFVQLFAGSAFAQAPSLRVMDRVVDGVLIDGSAAYPLGALEALGFRVRTASAGAVAVLGNDTLHFWMMSPYFRHGAQTHQLAFPPRELGGIAYLPEQFFIQWLPRTFSRFAYEGGAVVARSSAVRTVASTGAQPAPDARVTTPTPRTGAGANVPKAADKRIVVIDPGHGGRDPGRIGPGGLRESDVALSISKQIAAILRDRGYEVHLTRTTDKYIPLPERPRLANQWKGDAPVALFLSIHANASPSSAVRGFETFFLSEARTDDERRVAEMENEAIRFDEHTVESADAGLGQVLNTLRSDFLMRASHDLAAVVQDRLAGFHPGPNRGVKRAGFYVLVGSVMPSVLIETAFLSNRDDARLLGSTSFQQRVAGSIADGVDEFFRRNEHLWVQAR